MTVCMQVFQTIFISLNPKYNLFMNDIFDFAAFVPTYVKCERVGNFTFRNVLPLQSNNTNQIEPFIQSWQTSLLTTERKEEHMTTTYIRYVGMGNK